jgi:hypothetical protein
MAATAADGTLGYWPELSDVISSDPAKTSASKLNSPPTGWPKCFSDNATLKALLGKKGLSGKRCRLTGLPGKEDSQKMASVGLSVEDSFGNADKVQEACGWTVIKGFCVYELGDSEGSVFVGHKRWWNQKDTGVWIDTTPRPAGVTDMVLLESSLSTKQQIKMSDGVRSAAKERLALGGFAAAPAASAAAPSKPAASPAAPAKPKSKPPPTPPKLDFKGSESLEEMLTILIRGSPQAQTRAAAAIAAQAATGPVESKRIVAANGLQPLLLLLRRDGEVQDHAARAVMSAQPPRALPPLPHPPATPRESA